MTLPPLFLRVLTRVTVANSWASVRLTTAGVLTLRIMILLGPLPCLEGEILMAASGVTWLRLLTLRRTGLGSEDSELSSGISGGSATS